MIYIERHGNYTVFLDTWKVASHSTAVDALWASVPVLVLPQVTPRTCSLFSMWASVPVRVLRQGTLMPASNPLLSQRRCYLRHGKHMTQITCSLYRTPSIENTFYIEHRRRCRHVYLGRSCLSDFICLFIYFFMCKDAGTCIWDTGGQLSSVTDHTFSLSLSLYIYICICIGEDAGTCIWGACIYFGNA